MKKLVACIAVATMSVAAAGTAEAKAPATAVISFYGLYYPTNESFAIPYGQLDSSNACEGKRKFKLVGIKGSKSTTIDKGTTSRDGGLSAITRARDARNLDDLVVSVAKTKGCAKARFSFSKINKEVAEKAAARAADSIAQFLAVATRGMDAMFVGTVESSERKCASDRKIKLVRGDKVLDSTVTTAGGTWALHISKAEYLNLPGEIRAVVEKKTSECAGGKATYDPMDVPRG